MKIAGALRWRVEVSVRSAAQYDDKYPFGRVETLKVVILDAGIRRCEIESCS
jgi:hypothetical protein